MAILAMDGCDFVGSTPGVEERGFLGYFENPMLWLSTSGVHGGGALRLEKAGSADRSAEWEISTAGVSELYFACWINVINHNDGWITFREDGIDHVLIKFETDGTLRLLHGDGVTELADSDPSVPFTEDAYRRLEVHLVLDDSAGSVEVRVAEAGETPVTVFNVSGVDTVNGGTGVCTHVGCRTNLLSAGNTYFLLDDLVAQDSAGDWLGDYRIYSGLPDGDGAVTEWTPSTGTDHYALIDDATFDDTDSVGTQDAGDTDRVTLPSLGFPDTVVAVAAKVIATKDAIGDAMLEVGLRESGGSEDTAMALPVTSAAYLPAVKLSTANPATASPWTSAELAACELLFEAD